MATTMRRSDLALLLLLLTVVAITMMAGRCESQQVAIANVITPQIFDKFLYRRNEGGDCDSRGFYTYDAFIAAATARSDFGTKNHELAAFFANVAQETGSGCYVRETQDHRDPSYGNYYGRGPLQLTWNYNYEEAAKDPYIGADLLGNPELVATDALISFKTAIWFWTTQPESEKCPHACMNREPSDFGCTIRAINGNQECGSNAHDEGPEARVSYYKSFCKELGIRVITTNLYC